MSSELSKLNFTSCITFCDIFHTNDPVLNQKISKKNQFSKILCWNYLEKWLKNTWKCLLHNLLLFQRQKWLISHKFKLEFIQNHFKILFFTKYKDFHIWSRQTSSTGQKWWISPKIAASFHWNKQIFVANLYSCGEKSVIFCFALLLPHILVYFQRQELI